MKHLIFIGIVFFSLLANGQSSEDSLIILYQSENLIEVLKPLIPEIIEKEELYLQVIEYRDHKRYGVLENGEVLVYDRFYQLIEKYTYRDSICILQEYYELGNIDYQFRFIPQDSTYIHTLFYTDGKLKNQIIDNKDIESLTLWYPNGKIESTCIVDRSTNEEQCEYWDEDGHSINN